MFIDEEKKIKLKKKSFTDPTFGIWLSDCLKLTRNLETRNNPVWVLPNIWSLGQVKDTKFDTNSTREMLLNAAMFQGYSFYRFWVI